MLGTPQELVDHVLDFAHDDLRTLRLARLVCRSWNVSARVHTCRRLDLQVKEHELLGPPPKAFGSPSLCTFPSDASSTAAVEQAFPNTDLPPLLTSRSHKPGQSEHLLTRSMFTRLQSLFDILQYSPDMGHCVKEVVIGNTIHLEQPEQWKAYADILALIFSSLRRVSSLFLQHVYFPSPAFAHFLLEALPGTIELQRLELLDCRMPQVGDLVLLLNHFPVMTRLRLSNIHFKEFQGFNHNGVPASNCQETSHHRRRLSRKPLQKLIIDAVPLSPILSTLTSPRSEVDVTQLHSLTLSYVNDHLNFRRFLQVAGSHLEFLQISGSCYSTKYVDHQAMFNLSHTPRLKTLRIFGPKWMASLCPAENLQHVFNPPQTNDLSKPSPSIYTFSSPSMSPLSPAPLESVHIGVAAFRRDGEAFDCTKWSILDEILSSPAYASLSQVKMDIDVTLTGKRSIDAAKVVASFPRLREARKIRVACS